MPRLLPRHENQARGLAEYALDFVGGQLESPSNRVFDRLEQFHSDSVACGVAALAAKLNAPTILRDEALNMPAPRDGRAARCFGSSRPVPAAHAVAANCSAVRELDANGTNFGYNPRTGNSRGEFGHNDFYPVVVAAAEQVAMSGRQAALAMLCLDEIRGRLAEVFGLKDYKIDHVLHGGIAAAAVYGACLGATPDQIESAIGLVVAHYVPFRAIRHGHQLSDSKGASAALTTEMAITAVHRALRGFVGPADIFRNPQAVFCLFERPAEAGHSPFDLELAEGGDDFAIMGMHFKLGLYEHQSAGAIEAVIRALEQHPALAEQAADLERIEITIYEPAFSIIGDPAKRDPRTRQSADHSMVYIIATLLRKAHQTGRRGWRDLILTLDDYSPAALNDPLTRSLMERIQFRHGGIEFDQRYPDGIPTRLTIVHRELGTLDSGLVMYPHGHARADEQPLADLLRHKFAVLVQDQAGMSADDLAARLSGLSDRTPEQIRDLYAFQIPGVDDPFQEREA